jgi:hypothetical protein
VIPKRGEVPPKVVQPPPPVKEEKKQQTLFSSKPPVAKIEENPVPIPVTKIEEDHVMTAAKIEPKEDQPSVQSKTKQSTTPVKVAQQEDVQMKSAE